LIEGFAADAEEAEAPRRIRIVPSRRIGRNRVMKAIRDLGSMWVTTGANALAGGKLW